MQGLFKFLSSFYSPRNYTEMLRKLAFFLFWEVWIVTFFLRDIPTIDKAFTTFELLSPVKVMTSLLPSNANLNITGFLVAFIVATVSYAVQLHDQISNIVGIRRRFDHKYILLPLATLVGIKITDTFEKSLTLNRDSILRQVFYPYVSSRAKKTLVDKHDIERALDGWSWYWVLIEIIPVATVGAIVAALSGEYAYTMAFCIVLLVASIGSWLYFLKLPRLARPEIEAIAADTQARKNVIKAFRAI